MRKLAAVAELREKPAGTIRITATEYAIDSILVPKLAKLLRDYPDIKVEMIVDYGLTNIVAERYDAGVRSGEQVAKDMIAVRIGPDLRMAVVGAPSYFKSRPEPKRPQDLIGHNCINLRLPTHDSLYAWEFERGSRELQGARRWPTDLQRDSAIAERCACRLGAGLCAGRDGANAYRQGPSQARPRGLVPSLFGLPPLLSEPPPVLGGILPGGRCAALSAVMQRSSWLCTHERVLSRTDRAGGQLQRQLLGVQGDLVVSETLTGSDPTRDCAGTSLGAHPLERTVPAARALATDRR